VSTAGVSLDLIRELRAICGEEHVMEPDRTRWRHVQIQNPPATFVCPGSADEVVAILRLSNDRGFSIAPVGMPPALWCGVPPIDVALSTSRLTEVEHYDPADLTVGIGAGMTVAQLNALVADGKLMFGCDPAFPEHTTIGAVLAAAKHGPLRQGYGGVRDFCIGIRFVTGDGRKAKGGGRVVKNVAGYDLMKLLIGSYGTLAVITSASFKLFPAPRQTRTFLAEFGTWQEALRFRDLILRSPLSPMCLEIVSPNARKLMRPEMNDDAWVICIRAAGSDTVLARYHNEMGSAVAHEVEGDDEAKIWRAIQNFPHTDQAKPDPNWIEPLANGISITVPPAEVGAVVEVLERFSPPYGLTCAYIGRIGLGHFLLTVSYLDMEACLSLSGLPRSAQVSGNWKSLPELSSMRAVKHALDPNNVLRGRELL
jgi:glycolate oxidase FAD binding subunit